MNAPAPAPRRFAVFGDPVAHSLSPRIHRGFGAQCGIALEYAAIRASVEDFAATLATFADNGGAGANITLPFKQAAYALSVERGEFAQRVGAVNTLTRGSRGWRGDNTDGPGLVRDLTGRHRLDVRGRRGLLLGAGGAARAAAFALLDAGVDQLVIANRTPERGDALADAIGEPQRAHTRYWEDLVNCGSFELIVDATSAGHTQETLALPFSLVAPRALCYHLSYGAAATQFLAWSRAARAAQALDGLGMLVEQAAESFAIWHWQRPQTDDVYAQLRAELPLHATD